MSGFHVTRRVLKPAAVRAGLGRWVVAHGEKRAESWVGFHVLRHTCGSLLFANGWNAKQVQLQLGHHSPSFTLAVYVHVLASELPDHPGLLGDNEVTTRPTENHLDRGAANTPETRVSPGGSPQLLIPRSQVRSLHGPPREAPAKPRFRAGLCAEDRDLRNGGGNASGHSHGEPPDRTAVRRAGRISRPAPHFPERRACWRKPLFGSGVRKADSEERHPV